MSNEWRTHPSLKGRFNPDFPDDLQVIVHDGGPRLTKHAPELVWVRVNDMCGDIFLGQVLNQPHQLELVHQHSPIQFIVPHDAEYPLMVRDKYLDEREDWVIRPCDKCGCDELFDAPSDLIRVIFPDLPPDSELEMFSSFCGLCGGVQVVRHRSIVEDRSMELPHKRWWEVWKK